MCVCVCTTRERVPMVYLIEARWRMATSRAWTESRGTCSRPLTRVSCSRRHDTLASQRMDTLKIRSLPSPGMVTSKSTWRNRRQKGQKKEGRGKEHGWKANDQAVRPTGNPILYRIHYSRRYFTLQRVVQKHITYYTSLTRSHLTAWLLVADITTSHELACFCFLNVLLPLLYGPLNMTLCHSTWVWILK